MLCAIWVQRYEKFQGLRMVRFPGGMFTHHRAGVNVCAPSGERECLRTSGEREM